MSELRDESELAALSVAGMEWAEQFGAWVESSYLEMCSAFGIVPDTAAAAAWVAGTNP